MDTAMTSSSLTDRMMRAARLDVSLYEEVEADQNATSQALSVVVIAAVAGGIGMLDEGGVGGLIRGVLSGVIGWAVWSYVMYFVGTRFFGGTATWGEVLRTLGFAATPGVLAVLGIIPVLGGLVLLVAGIWQLVTGFVAIRQALDISNGATFGTIVVGIIAYVVVAAIIGVILATLGLAGGLMPAI